MNLKNGMVAVLLVIAMLVMVPVPVSAGEINFTKQCNITYDVAYDRHNINCQMYGDDTYLIAPTMDDFCEFPSHHNHTNSIEYSSAYPGGSASYGWGTIYNLTGSNNQNPTQAQTWRDCSSPSAASNVVWWWFWGHPLSVPKPIYDYSNVTINVKSNQTGLNIPRADVVIRPWPTSTIEGKTDLEGNVTFLLVGISEDYQPNVTVSKTGYNTTTIKITENPVDYPEIYRSISLNDVPAPPGGTASVYLDIADGDTGAAITGATVGIQNTTATIDQWTYGTYAESTILFNKTGVVPPINLSVGQNIAFAGYKSGVYEANNTGTYQIPSPVSHLELLLKKVVGNTTAQYHYPVTITAADTGNSIGSSTLKTAFYTGSAYSNWYNSSSSTGKFNLTGVGTGGKTPLKSGDIVSLTGNATGFIEGGFFLQVDDDSNGVTQFVNLVPSSYQPISGEFTAVILVYDEDSTAALSGASVTMKTGNSSTAKTTGASGVATFKNLTAGDVHQMTVSKTGYTKVTKNIVGGSESVVYEDVPMSPVGINPTATATTAPGSAGDTSSELNEKGASGLNEFMDLVISGKLWLLGLLLIMIFAIRKAFGVK